MIGPMTMKDLTMNKRTPGPWKVGANIEGTFFIYQEAIQSIVGWHVTLPKSPSVEPDAFLIAAAPCMLEALQMIVVDNRLMNAMKREQQQAILNAIKKTERFL